NDRALAERLPGLPPLLRELGKVPAAFLSEACGCKGLTIGGAGVSPQHANFIVNRNGATAADIRATAETVKARGLDRFDVRRGVAGGDRMTGTRLSTDPTERLPASRTRGAGAPP